MPATASAAPAFAKATAQASYEMLLSGGVITAVVPGIEIEALPIFVGDVLGTASATGTLNCPLGASFCLFGGSVEADVTANDGHVRAEADVQPFSISFDMAVAGLLLVNGLAATTSTSTSPGAAPAGVASATSVIHDFSLIGLGAPFPFSVGAGGQEDFLLAIGSYQLTWEGLRSVAEAQRALAAVPAPAGLLLLATAAAMLAGGRRRSRRA